VYPRLVLFALIFVAPPFAKRWLLRWFCDARIGRRVHLGWFCSVVGSSVEIGDYAVVNGLTLIWADGGVKIGAYSEVSAFNLIYGSGRLEMGAHCYIGPMTMLNVTENLTLGDVRRSRSGASPGSPPACTCRPASASGARCSCTPSRSSPRTFRTAPSCRATQRSRWTAWSACSAR
jgi:acetyltransferase-like isoleucine patch superfamily enzyme